MSILWTNTLAVLTLALTSSVSSCARQTPQPPTALWPAGAGDPLGCARLQQAETEPLLASGEDLEVTPITKDEVGALDESDMDGWAGVRIEFPAPEGWTKPWLSRRVACYRSSNATIGPLAVAGSDVSVRTREGRFSVWVTSANPITVAQIWDASLALLQRHAALHSHASRLGSAGATSRKPLRTSSSK